MLRSTARFLPLLLRQNPKIPLINRTVRSVSKIAIGPVTENTIGGFCLEGMEFFNKGFFSHTINYFDKMFEKPLQPQDKQYVVGAVLFLLAQPKNYHFKAASMWEKGFGKKLPSDTLASIAKFLKEDTRLIKQEHLQVFAEIYNNSPDIFAFTWKSCNRLYNDLTTKLKFHPDHARNLILKNLKKIIQIDHIVKELMLEDCFNEKLVRLLFLPKCNVGSVLIYLDNNSELTEKQIEKILKKAAKGCDVNLHNEPGLLQKSMFAPSVLATMKTQCEVLRAHEKVAVLQQSKRL